MKHRLLAPLTAALVLACSSEVVNYDQSTAATIYGRVTAPGGNPVGGVAVAATAFNGSCDADHWFALDDAVTTEGTGRYRVRPISFGGDFTGCVILEVRPPGGSGFRIDTVRVENVPFRTTTRDSIAVDLVLRP